MLDIKNSIIALDAMGSQREIAQQIIKQKADYILPLKGNHSGMQAELEAWLHKKEREDLSDEIFSLHNDVRFGHSRIETRTCQQLLIDKAWLDKKYQWQALDSVRSHWEVESMHWVLDMTFREDESE